MRACVLEGSGRAICGKRILGEQVRVAVVQGREWGQVELGAAWFHGLVDHPLYELALKHGLMEPWDRKGARRADKLPSTCALLCWFVGRSKWIVSRERPP